MKNELQKNILFSQFSTMRVGGKLDFYVVATTEDELIESLRKAKKNGIPFFVFGGASNMLISDEGYRGCAIQYAGNEITIDGTSVYAQAGTTTAILAGKIAHAGLTDFEWAIGIPGRLGGAVYGNAGAMGGEMKDVVISVRVYDPEQEKIFELKNSECGFNYRESNFKKNGLIVLGATFALQKGERARSETQMREYLIHRSATQPKGFLSCGCMFKNYECTESEVAVLLAQGAPPDQCVKKRISAGWLVEHADAKGMRIGNAMVSDVHGNFVVNCGHTTVKEIRDLINTVKTGVKAKFGVVLQEEVQFYDSTNKGNQY